MTKYPSGAYSIGHTMYFPKDMEHTHLIGDFTNEFKNALVDMSSKVINHPSVSLQEYENNLPRKIIIERECDGGLGFWWRVVTVPYKGHGNVNIGTLTDNDLNSIIKKINYLGLPQEKHRNKILNLIRKLLARIGFMYCPLCGDSL